MFARALTAFLVLPGMVAGVLPALIVTADPWGLPGRPIGSAVIGLGLVLLIWCVRDFYVAGKGTLAPWSPPERLVTVGLYRHVRNPMYVSVLLILTGWVVTSGSAVMTIYTLAVAAAFHFRVIRREEPWLARNFGPDWAEYSQAVHRWRPRLKPWPRQARA